ncbi:hypothetical protein JHK87_024548 [Glycine soja]|nr:hypothetical protein JHK87_024548 [Glycine soja]
MEGITEGVNNIMNPLFQDVGFDLCFLKHEYLKRGVNEKGRVANDVETEQQLRKKKSRKYRTDQGLYAELSEAMECLEHICYDGCTHVEPYDAAEVKRERTPCGRIATCQALQVLIRHFATCEKKVRGGCVRCKRMLQLFRLHSYLCHHTDSSCKVPFLPVISNFKLKSTLV